MEVNVRDWAPDMDRWPRSWLGVGEDLEYGKKLLPYFEEFLRDLIEQGIARKTFAQYRDNVWLLGGSIISKVSLFEGYSVDPLEKLIESVECDGILSDGYHMMSTAELRSFERMCRRLEMFLRVEYQSRFASWETSRQWATKSRMERNHHRKIRNRREPKKP